MLQEMKIEDALKKFLQGKKVLVMYDETLGADKPEFTVEPLEEILKRNRFLVDVPAIENPDFKQAVEKMVKPKKTSTKTTKKKLANPPHNKSKLDEREDEIIQMLKDGKSQREIAQDLGVTPSTSSYWMSRHGIDKSGIRKKCSTCLYRDKNPKKGNCDYIGKTGHSRNCSVENCDKYMEDKREETIPGENSTGEDS